MIFPILHNIDFVNFQQWSISVILHFLVYGKHLYSQIIQFGNENVTDKIRGVFIHVKVWVAFWGLDRWGGAAATPEIPLIRQSQNAPLANL